ncbi:MAG TPA: cytochrome c3 family protein [Pyrinomonadaceae bacterium]
MRLTIIVAALFGYLLLTFACNHSSNSTSVVLNSSIASPDRGNAAIALDGTNPPHAVDLDGKAIPDESLTQPSKPFILAKDSESKDGEMKKEAAFDHAKHSTDPKYSVDGKMVMGCAECHHTDQPKAPAGQEYLKKFERKEMLTAAVLEKSKQPVKSCRACHLQASAEATDDYPPDSITYSKESGKASTKDKIVNEEAYHLNCNTCHDQAMKNKSRATPAKAPSACADCHTQKKS